MLQSNKFIGNSNRFQVKPGEFINARICYRGIKGRKFSSYAAVIWTRGGKEISRELYWIVFNDKDTIMLISSIAPKMADGCLIGLRINNELPTLIKSDIDLIIDDLSLIKIDKINITNLHRFFILKILRKLKNFLPPRILTDKDKSLIKLINYIGVKIQLNIVGNSFLLGYPYMAMIDPSNICNYRCPLCPTGRSDGSRKKCIMKLEEFKLIMDQIGNYLYSLHLYNWGEPFLNKDLAQMIKYAKKFGIIVYLSSNMSLLNETLAKDLVESELDVLIVSLDGVSDKSYSKYRVSGELKNILDNLNLIISLKNRLNSSYPSIVLSFVVNKYNENEIPHATQLAEQLGVSIGFSKIILDMCDSTLRNKEELLPFKDWLPVNSDLSLYDSELNIQLSDYCNWPWEKITINSDGSASPCCAIYSERYDFGNVFKNGFWKTWNGKKYIEARKIIKDKKANEDPNNPCNYCINKDGFLHYQPEF